MDHGSYAALVVITLIYGVADGAFLTTYNVIILNAVGNEQRPYAYGCANAAISVAIGLGPMITGLVADRHSYREAFIMTVGNLNCAGQVMNLCQQHMTAWKATILGPTSLDLMSCNPKDVENTTELLVFVSRADVNDYGSYEIVRVKDNIGHERTCNGGTSSKRKADDQVNDSPSKKQKLNELIAFELNHIPEEMMEEYEGPLFGDDVRQEVLLDDDVRQEGGELNMAGIDYPVKIDQVKKFERQNPTISVSVFGYEEQELFPLYVTKDKKELHVNLLLYSQDTRRHYCLIRDLDRLLHSLSRHHGRMYHCNYCMHGFVRQDLLDDHEPHCGRHGPQKIKLPDEDHTTLQYTEEATELQQDLMTLPDDGTEGYILEVDLSYPEELHDLHNDYPLAPERQKVTQDMLSPYCQQLNEELNLGGAPVAKLVPNLNDKQHYILHYRNLKQYLSLGMKLTKVHRVLGFDQSPWLKSYIDFNTEKRKHATNDFEKDFFKLMNNSVFGKTMENLRKRVSVKLINTPKQLKKLTANPLFDYFRIFDENLVGVDMKKPSLYLNRPIYVGFCILDISKILMYDFHYNVIKQKYGNNATLLFTDTDSLCYNIKTEDIYEDMYEDLDLYDTSEYPRDHVLHSTVNKKVLGKMKDETHGLPIEEFVGLRPKMYSLLYHEEGREVEKKTAKGYRGGAGGSTSGGGGYGGETFACLSSTYGKGGDYNQPGREGGGTGDGSSAGGPGGLNAGGGGGDSATQSDDGAGGGGGGGHFSGGGGGGAGTGCIATAGGSGGTASTTIKAYAGGGGKCGCPGGNGGNGGSSGGTNGNNVRGGQGGSQ
ncbi:hypothetical protein QZH41_003614 [Actinostola sp. cb2023]|nr:hypothetical protein QZH41_003614 [Actinostola sp. cb2023]